MKNQRRHVMNIVVKPLLLTLLALNLMLPGAGVSRQPRVPFTATGSEAGARRAAPSFTLPDLDGKTVASAELKGRVFILDFWATWCKPCIKEIPTFNRLQEKYARRGLRSIGIAVQSGWARDVGPHVARYKMKYTVLVGTDETVEQFRVIALPTTYVVTQDWKIYRKYIGAMPDKEAKLQQDIEKLLAHP